MYFPYARKSLMTGRGIYRQAFDSYPATVIQSVAKPGILNRLFPSPLVKEHTDRHERKAIREALGMLRDDTIAAYGAGRCALDEGDARKASAIFYAAGIHEDPHIVAILDRHFTKRDGRPSVNQRYCDARRYERESARRQEEWYKNSLELLEREGTSWERIAKDIYEKTHPRAA